MLFILCDLQGISRVQILHKSQNIKKHLTYTLYKRKTYFFKFEEWSLRFWSRKNNWQKLGDAGTIDRSDLVFQYQIKKKKKKEWTKPITN